jgi:hypothetical protein
MNAIYFRYTAGTILLSIHFIAIAIISTSWRFDMLDDQIGSVLSVIPVTLVYVLAFVKYVVTNAAGQQAAEAPFNLPATLVMLFIIVLFSISLLYVVIKFAYFSSYRVEELKMWLGVVETGFGALIGLIFERLFGVKIEREEIPG